MSFGIRELSVFYGKKQALDAIDLEIHDGEFFGILGPSGCGKSTLLKTIAGLLPQQSGHLMLDGVCIDALPAYKRGITMVFQDLRLFPHMTVLENVAYPLRMAGVKKAQRAQRAAEMLAQVQLEAYGTRRPNELSGGQQQRVVLARALVARPRMLLLDEPFSSLDASLRADMQLLVRQLHERHGLTTVLVTHDLEEALQLADRMAVMDGGRLLQCGTPQEVYERPATERVAEYFIKENHITGRVQNGRFLAPGLAFAADRPDGPYTACLRPELVAVAPGDAGDFTVERAAYLGETFQLHLRHNHAPLALTAKTTQNVLVGARVNVVVEKKVETLYPVAPAE